MITFGIVFLILLIMMLMLWLGMMLLAPYDWTKEQGSTFKKNYKEGGKNLLIYGLIFVFVLSIILTKMILWFNYSETFN